MRVEAMPRPWIDRSRTCLAALLILSVFATVVGAAPLAGAQAQEGGDAERSDTTSVPSPSTYQENLAMLRSSSVRNTNHDASPYRNVPMADLRISDHLGPRSEYLGNPGGNPEQSFPVANGGQFRTSCEFSHFGYDDPVVFPGEPGVAHLHVFWGNTDTNAYSTYDTLLNSGSGTCNGQELNRTGYWAPAMFDGNGNVRIPERIVVYYKGEGLANGASAAYPPGSAIIPQFDINARSTRQGGAEGKYSYKCSDQWSGSERPQANTIPDCDGSRYYNEYGVLDNPHVVLEMNVKFPQCWNGRDAADPANYAVPEQGGWYYSLCPDGWVTLPNLEYFINYRVEVGESTAGWFLSSDIDSTTFAQKGPAGASIHADWWGAWHPEINQRWLDNCVNFSVEGEESGCGFGYLTNGGPDNDNPLDGPALKFRPQYTGGSSVPAAVLFDELCQSDRAALTSAEMAYCIPRGHDMTNPPEPTPTTPPTPEPIATATAAPRPTAIPTSPPSASPTPVPPTPSATPAPASATPSATQTPRPAQTTAPTVTAIGSRACRGRPATIVGTSGPDVLRGTPGDDVIWAGGGDDVVRSGGGNDLICAGRGNDRIFAGAGDDVVWAGPGDDRVVGADGVDTVWGGQGNDLIFGNAGDDDLRGNSGSDRVRGGNGFDRIRGGVGDDLLAADRHGGRMFGGSGNDQCRRHILPSPGWSHSCELRPRV